MTEDTDDAVNAWRVDDGHQTLVLAATGDALPGVVYWGPPLGAGEDLREVARAAVPDVNGGMLDAVVPITLCPTHGDGFAGQPGLSVLSAEGAPLLVRLSRTDVAREDGALVVRAADEARGLRYAARIATTAQGVLRLRAAVETDAPVRLRWLAAPVLAVSARAGAILAPTGRWLGELRFDRVPWTDGIHMREALTGRSGHEHPPFACLVERGTTNTGGAVFALAYGWSGGHRFAAEALPDGRRQVQMGHAAGSEVQPGTRFETATLFAAQSEAGLNGAAVRMQALVRDALVPWPDPARPRPVHYNCWEAVYFRHDLATLGDLADRAARIGAERFVLDDGWFGRRDDDTTSLGDWTVDRRKWPGGLHPLIERVHGAGMAFGLWVEPEMVNPDSDLLRAHPDWILGPADQVMGRGQYVLDMGRAAVRDHLFGAVDALLREYPVDYVKWDHNRVLPVAEAAQARGFYALLDRLRAAHPGVEFESCASGGGRIDYGVLARAHRVWLSDSNDAVERLRIQHDAALFLPGCVTGAHVGPRTSHSSGRTLPVAFRAWVAASRHLGFEMDLRALSPEEEATLARVTAWWRVRRDWLMAAAIHRLDPDDGAVTAELHLSADGARFVVFAGQAGASRAALPRPLRLAGLDPNAAYSLRLANPEDAPPTSRGAVALRDGPLRLSGRHLMAGGVTLPVAWPATMWVLEGKRAG